VDVAKIDGGDGEGTGQEKYGIRQRGQEYYRKSFRNYRPVPEKLNDMKFADIHGLEEIKERLVTTVESNHMAHAIMLAGKPGAPNLPLALALSTFVLCENRGKDACGTCDGCLKAEKFIHPDLNFVFPVAPVKGISGKDVISRSFMKEWRKFLLEDTFGSVDHWAVRFGGEDKELNISKEESRNIINTLSLKAFEGSHKVMLIWLPEYMHPAASNGILKILEEPAERTLFLLVTNDMESLMTTILSRTQIVQVRRFNETEMTGIIIEKYGVEKERAQVLAKITEGDISVAMDYIDHDEKDTPELFKKWMRSCFSRNLAGLVEHSEEFHRANKVEQKGLLKYMLYILRESMVFGLDSGDLGRSDDSDREFIGKFSKFLNEGKIGKITAMVDEAFYHLERNASARIMMLDLSLKISTLLRQ